MKLLSCIETKVSEPWLSSVSYFRSSYKEVHVRLGDMNDHSPVFEREEFHVRVSEAALVNTPIKKLKVSPVISDRMPMMIMS